MDFAVHFETQTNKLSNKTDSRPGTAETLQTLHISTDLSNYFGGWTFPQLYLYYYSKSYGLV